MAIAWLALVPWTEVIKAAPAVIENAKKLWNSVSKKPLPTPPPITTGEKILSVEAETIAVMESRISDMEVHVGDLDTQMRASSELIKTLADQNGQLISRIEANRRLVVWLIVATAATSVVSVACLFLVLTRS
jgi:hypothetical protein